MKGHVWEVKNTNFDFKLTNFSFPIVSEIQKKKLFDHGRDRTCNLLLRRQTPYPLGHAAADDIKSNF